MLGRSRETQGTHFVVERAVHPILLCTEDICLAQVSVLVQTALENMQHTKCEAIVSEGVQTGDE